MKNLPLLLKREYWEHRGGFLWTPFWISTAILIITVLGIITAEVFGSRLQVNVGVSLAQLRDAISAADMVKAGQGLDVSQMAFVGMASFGLFFVTFFYLLGALYDDRRDRSVLFWKSLPVSDSATVVSKALTAMLVIPAFVIAITTLAYLILLAVVCLWVGAHGINPFPAIAAAHPLGVFMRLVGLLPVFALWSLPTVGWLLFWSAFARSKPFLWAVLLPMIALMANWWIGLLGGPHISGDLHLASILGRLLFSAMPGSWMSTKFGASGINFPNEDVIGNLGMAQMYGVFGTANLWIGVVAGLALLAAAVWLRGRRIETST